MTAKEEIKSLGKIIDLLEKMPVDAQRRTLASLNDFYAQSALEIAQERQEASK